MSRKQPWLLYKTDQGLPQLLLKALQQENFAESLDKNNHESWNLYWKACGFTLSDYRNVKGWQILNHFPKGNTITRKDSLARGLKRMRMVYGSVYGFFPVSFNLPNDYTKFLSYFTKIQSKKGKQVWICKPSDLSRGRGIFLFSSVSDLLYDGSTVVQRYIEDPYLIGGYKFDLRLYVVVTSYHPLRIYLYHNGLVRFSTEKYVGSMIHNKFAHLTNTSINRNGPGYSVEKERIGAGCKWTIAQLRGYFQQCNVDDRLVWERIKHMITLTILIQANSIPDSAKQCVELYGFDVILDRKLRPWLLEVNFTPALGNDCSADVAVKLPMLADFLSLCRQKIRLPRPATELHRKRNPKEVSRISLMQKEERYLKLLVRESQELSLLHRVKADQSRVMKSIARHEILRQKCRLIFEKRTAQQQKQFTNRARSEESEESDYDDIFKNRFIMDEEEVERMREVESRCRQRIPDLKNTSSIIEQSYRETSSVRSVTSSSVSSRVSTTHTAPTGRSRGGARPMFSGAPPPAEQMVGGFYLTFPISEHSPQSSKGCIDISKAVSDIRNTLRISERNFKFMSPEHRQLYEKLTVKWNALSGF